MTLGEHSFSYPSPCDHLYFVGILYSFQSTWRRQGKSKGSTNRETARGGNFPHCFREPVSSAISYIIHPSTLKASQAGKVAEGERDVEAHGIAFLVNANVFCMFACVLVYEGLRKDCNEETCYTLLTSSFSRQI
jgi:hypothetical protein